MIQFLKVYKQICSCVSHLNEIHGFSLVLSFTHDFSLATSQLFCLFYLGSNYEFEIVKLPILTLLIWIFPNVLKVSFICIVCHFTKNEVGNFFIFQSLF